MEQAMTTGPHPVNQWRQGEQTLSKWECLSEQKQRELVVTLVGMVTQQLPSRLTRQGASDER
jgi:hypothetical protein